MTWIKLLADRISKRVNKIYAIKAIVVDLDNTLWHGAIADVGVDGLQMSPPSLLGQVFGDIQKFIKERQKEGIVYVFPRRIKWKMQKMQCKEVLSSNGMTL